MGVCPFRVKSNVIVGLHLAGAAHYSYLACSINAIIPAANGAAAEVPVCLSVHPVPVPSLQSVVTWTTTEDS